MSLVVFILVCLATASSGAIFRPGDWYEDLNHPRWRPPNWLFGPVWSVLYLMIAIAGWLVWTRAEPGQAFWPMVIYGVQLALNYLWSALFFGINQMRMALAEMALLWLSILATIIAFWPISALAGALLIPYLAWVSFAFVLNLALVRLNPEAA